MNSVKYLLQAKMRNAWAECAPVIRRHYGEDDYHLLLEKFWEKFEEVWDET
jgi:hypothetical protein